MSKQTKKTNKENIPCYCLGFLVLMAGNYELMGRYHLRVSNNDTRLKSLNANLVFDHRTGKLKLKQNSKINNLPHSVRHSEDFYKL